MTSDVKNVPKSVEKKSKKVSKTLKTVVETTVLAKSKRYVAGHDHLSGPKTTGSKNRRKLSRAPLSAEAKTRKHHKAYGKKKEAKKVRQEIAKNTQSNKQDLALRYLEEWQTRNEGGTWKFSKLRQAWLIKNMYCKDKVPKKDFKVLLEYLKGLSGQRREQLIGEAEVIYKNCEAEMKKAKKGPVSDTCIITKRKFKRSRKIIGKLL